MTQKLLKKIEDFTSIDTKVRSGALCFKGTEVPVSLVVKHFAKGWTNKDIVKLFPDVKLIYINKLIRYLSEDLSLRNEKTTKTTWTNAYR